jgi:hypothetical protein
MKERDRESVCVSVRGRECAYGYGCVSYIAHTHCQNVLPIYRNHRYT